jgi:hypothetical protein
MTMLLVGKASINGPLLLQQNIPPAKTSAKQNDAPLQRDNVTDGFTELCSRLATRQEILLTPGPTMGVSGKLAQIWFCHVLPPFQIDITKFWKFNMFEGRITIPLYK